MYDDHRPFRWLAINTGGRERRSEYGHVLEESMELCSIDQIHNAIMWEPPTRQQAMILLLEEMRGRNRQEVFQMFASMFPNE